jgi:hypothetical protein
MSVNSHHNHEADLRERAYFIWESEGRPSGRAQDHWLRALTQESERPGEDEALWDDEEKILAGRPDVNMPALLPRDVQGG